MSKGSVKELESDVRSVVSEVTGRDVSALGLDEDLVAKTGCDSVTALHVLAVLEDRLDLLFPDEHLELPRTLRDLVANVAYALDETEESCTSV
ncbi:MAG: acyl carrier protein [Planctomycetota bacterium]